METMLKVKKRNGDKTEFDIVKIIRAISKANNEVEEDNRFPTWQIKEVASEIKDVILFEKGVGGVVDVEDIQDKVETALMASGAYKLAKTYVKYRYKQAQKRKLNTTDDVILKLIDDKNEDARTENANKDTRIISTIRDYMAGEVSRDLMKRYLLSEDVVEAHERGEIHFHDTDYHALPMHNCCLINLEDMLQNGTVIGKTTIDKPHSFSTACNIALQVVAQVASSQSGGQTISLAHLAPFVDVSRKKIEDQVKQEGLDTGIEYTDQQFNKIVHSRVLDEIRRGVQTIQYQVITLMTTNGQAPFLSVNMQLGEAKNDQEKEDLALIIEEVLKQRLQGVKNETGEWVTPAFPKLLYVLEEDNVYEESEYFYLTKLAAKCTVKRMNPDFISAKMMKKLKVDANGNGNIYPCMGCRSFLTPYLDEDSKPKYYGRFNQGVVTINLPYVALKAGGDPDKFWQELENTAELVHKALQQRHSRLEGTKSDVAPILWQHGALARLEKGEKIDKLLHNGYSTLSIGYAGLYECVKCITGESHTKDSSKPFAKKILQTLIDYTKKWKAEEKIDYSLYGTPMESTTYKFAKAIARDFEPVDDVNTHNYITNSYHVNVREEIDAFTKLKIEGEYQALSPGGAVSYVEVPDLSNNIQAVLSVMKTIYDNCIYAELNTKNDYCQECGFNGQILIKEDDDGKPYWECPNCGNTNEDKMNKVRRICGYLGDNPYNQGRTEEIKDRVLHL